MIDLNVTQYVILFLLVTLAGLIDSIAGGGGLITIPTYIALGIPQPFILGTNKCVSTLGTTIAVLRFSRSSKVFWKMLILGIVTALIGSLLGAYLSSFLSKKYMLILLVIVIPLILYFSSHKVPAAKNFVWEKKYTMRLLLIGFLLGAYDGFFGPGTGTFLLIAFVSFLHMDYKNASIHSRMINYASNLSAFFFFLFSGKILWKVALIAAIASMLGNFIGSGLVLTKAEKVVRPLFFLVICLLLIKSFYDLL
ncbi:MAG: TSUP family transporter [Bacteriovoracaceae bacterium]|nr:TSUP family transporter [Bacteriovoracaceae bacterium]